MNRIADGSKSRVRRGALETARPRTLLTLQSHAMMLPRSKLTTVRLGRVVPELKNRYERSGNIQA